MKYVLLLFTFVLLEPTSAQEIPGLVAHWKMDNTCQLSDEVTESPVNGVLIDVSFTSNKDNVPDAAFLFQSNTSYITLGATEKLKLTGDKSISFWIKPAISGTNRTGSVFAYGTGIIVRYEEQSSAARLHILFGNISYMVVNLLANQWQQVTITFKKDFSTATSKTYCYINGTQTAGTEQNKSTPDFNNSIAIIGAANQATLTNGFRGSLDDLRIYDRELTATEVLNLVLPVKLEFFRGKRVNGVVELSWKTQMEENVSHFNLQKSQDGVNFQTISKVNAGKYNYLTYDVSGIPFSTIWYRLQIVDRDGKTEFSNIIRINSGDNDESTGPAIKLFPNPGSDYVQFIGIPVNGHCVIVNNAGAIIKQKQFSAGKSINISDLPSGLYYLLIVDGNKRTILKFVKR